MLPTTLFYDLQADITTRREKNTVSCCYSEKWLELNSNYVQYSAIHISQKKI